MNDQPDANVGSLAHQSNEPLTITINNTEFSLRPLGPADFAASQKHIVGQRLNHFLEAVSLKPLADAVKAQAIAGIMNVTPFLHEVIDSFEGKLFLIWRSARHGQMGLTLDVVRKHINENNIAALTDIVFQITGLTKASDGEDADPLVVNSVKSTTNDSETTGAV